MAPPLDVKGVAADEGDDRAEVEDKHSAERPAKIREEEVAHGHSNVAAKNDN